VTISIDISCEDEELNHGLTDTRCSNPEWGFPSIFGESTMSWGLQSSIGVEACICIMHHAWNCTHLASYVGLGCMLS
jgi:hypothetical protein